MTVRWDVAKGDVEPALVEAVDATLGPLPTLYAIIQGLRTDAQQNALFAKGRNAQGVVIAPQDTVTNARAGQSAHNPPFQAKSRAVDFVPVVSGAYFWNNPDTDPRWQTAILSVKANPFLKSGADIVLPSGRDWDHIEIRNWQSYVSPPVFSPPDATGIGGVTGGGGASSTPGLPDGSPPPFTSSDGQATWFELDPGVMIGLGALLGLGLLLWMRKGQ